MGVKTKHKVRGPEPKKMKPGHKERVAFKKNEAMRLRTERGMTLVEISKEIGVSFSRVYQMLEEEREVLNQETKSVGEALRNSQAARYLAIIKQWLPIVLQPMKTARIQRMGAKGPEIVDELVFNAPAVDAANVLFKAEAQLARLMGLNLEQQDDKSVDKEKFMVWVNNVVNVSHAKSLEGDGKTFDTVLRMGKLEIAPEPEQAI